MEGERGEAKAGWVRRYCYCLFWPVAVAGIEGDLSAKGIFCKWSWTGLVEGLMGGG